MKVKLLRDARVLVPAGTQMEIADEGARQLVALGSAVEMKNKWEAPEKPKVEKAEEPIKTEEVEKASKPKAKK